MGKGQENSLNSKTLCSSTFLTCTKCGKSVSHVRLTGKVTFLNLNYFSHWRNTDTKKGLREWRPFF